MNEAAKDDLRQHALHVASRATAIMSTPTFTVGELHEFLQDCRKLEPMAKAGN